MPITTITTIPTEVLQFFDSALLSRPMPKFREDSETIEEIFYHIQYELLPRFGCIKKRFKYQKLKKQYQELYERIKVKEKELKEKGSHQTQGPMYYFRTPDCLYGRLFRRLKYARRKTIQLTRWYL